MKKLLLLLLGIIWVFPALSLPFEYEGNILEYFVEDEFNKTCSVSSGGNQNLVGNIQIPAHIKLNNEEYTVTTINPFGFSMCTRITSVTFPSTLTSIGENAFTGCEGLTEIILPESIKKIGGAAFVHCSNLSSINIPNEVTCIEERTFSNCHNLTSIIFPEGVTSIGFEAFNSCEKLYSINLPKSLINIGDRAFMQCSSLNYIDFPSSLISIGSEAFQECYNLTSILIPDSVTSIGFNAFYGGNFMKFAYPKDISYNFDGTNYSHLISYDRTECSINEGCLYGSYGKELLFSVFNGTKLIIPIGITRIKENAFSGCEINELILQEGIITIEKNAFAECKIGELTLPASLEEIEEDAFWTSVTPVNPSPIGKTIFADWEKFYKDVKLGNLYSNPYRTNGLTAGGIKVHAPELKEGMTEIPDYKNVGLVPYKGEINLPSTLKRIGAAAFYSNKEVYNVFLPEGLESIGDYAFAGCELLENPVFPESLKEIGDGAFAGCSSITEITLPAGLTKLGDQAPGNDPFFDERRYNNGEIDYNPPYTYPYIGVFDHCSKLEKAVLLSDIDYLGGHLFNSCDKLNLVYLPLSLKSINDYAFYNCIELEEITFPSTLESIGEWAFAQLGNYGGSGKLSKLSIPNSVTSIGSSAFLNQGISMLSIGSGVEVIPEDAFGGNDNLKTIELSEGLKEIKRNAFTGNPYMNCGPISSLTLPSTLTTIGEYAFRDWSILELVIPDRIKELPSGSCGKPSLITIGSGVRDMAADAFTFDNLRTLRVKTNTPPTLSEAFNISNEQNDRLTLVVNNGRRESFTTNARWKQIDEIIEEDQTEVTIYMTGDYYISEEIRTTTGLMPAVISKMAVVGPLTEKDWSLIKENMPALQKLDLSRVTNLTSIPAEQFSGSLLQEIVFPDKLEEIGSNAFYNCSLLKLDALPETVKYIRNGAFESCPRVSISRLPSALETMGSRAFSGCSGIRSLTGNSNLKSMGGSVFAACSLMEFCDLSETKLERIDDGTFSGCYALEEIILPESVASIGNEAFSGTAIRDIDFAANVSEIGESAFSSTRRLVSANLPKKIEVLPNNTFSNCPRLIAASMAGNVKTVENSVFDGDSKLANISCSAAEAPEASKSSFEGIRMRYVSLTIPGVKFRDYLNAPGWGSFQSIQNKIDLTIYDGVDVSNIAESEYQDMLKQDAIEEAVRESSADPALLSRSAERRARQTRAAAEGRIFANLFDGAQIQTGNDGTGTRVFINPQPGVTVTSITYDGKELISEYKDNSVLLPAKSKGSLVIKTSEGYTSVDKLPVQEFDGPVEVFDLNGLKIGNTTENLSKGIYVVRQGSKVKKIVVK